MNFLKDKVIVVLGASSGIGAAISEYFLKYGAKVQIAARREERLIELNNKFNSANQQSFYTVCDATNIEDVRKVGAEAIKNYGHIDLWVNCAGQNKAVGQFWDIDPDVTWSEVDTNLRSCIYGTYVAMQYMMPRNSGRIFNFCGGGAAQPHLYAAGYSASKTGVARFTEAVQMELDDIDTDVKVFCGNPGLVLVERTVALVESEEGKKFMPNLKEAFDEGRCQPPETIAKFIAYTLSGEIDNYAGRLVQAPKDMNSIIKNNSNIKGTNQLLLRPSQD